MRGDKPVGIWLVLCPALWGLTLAYKGLPPLKDILIFAVGSFLVRGAGCTYNDFVDQQVDRQVDRTKNRPLARKALSSKQAFIFLALQLLLAASLLLWMPLEVFYMALGAVGLILIYPWLKKITYWPQLFLGFAMNYSLLMAYVSVKQTLDVVVLLLYGGSIFWTLGYDTLYAHQDKVDDRRIGVKSTALVFENHTKFFVFLCYSIFLTSVGLVIVSFEMSLWAFAGLVMPLTLLLGQIFLVDLRSPSSCGRAFRSNQWVGFFIEILLILGFWAF